MLPWSGRPIIAAYFTIVYQLSVCHFIISTQHNGASVTCRIPKAPGADIKIARVISKFSLSQGFLISAVSRVPLLFSLFSGLVLLAHCIPFRGRYSHFLSDGDLLSYCGFMGRAVGILYPHLRHCGHLCQLPAHKLTSPVFLFFLLER